MASVLTPEFLFNMLGVAMSLIAVYYWVMLYRKMYQSKHDFRGWQWLFASAFAILVLNISSTYIVIAGQGAGGLELYGASANPPLTKMLDVLSRTIIVFSMTVGVYLIYSPLKSGFVYALAPVGIKSEEASKEKLKYSLNPSQSYLIPEKTAVEFKTSYAVRDRSSTNTMGVFTDLISHGIYGLIVTREFPGQVRKNWDVDSLPVLWLTNSNEPQSLPNVQQVNPNDLSGLSHAIREFIIHSEDSVVVIDGIEYLIVQNNFPEVLKFIQSLNDTVSQRKSRILVPLDYKTLGETEIHLLRRELCELTVV
jgi:hypothetical protein